MFRKDKREHECVKVKSSNQLNLDERLGKQLVKKDLIEFPEMHPMYLIELFNQKFGGTWNYKFGLIIDAKYKDRDHFVFQVKNLFTFVMFK